MKKLFFLLVCVAMSMLSMAQSNQLVWANGRLLYGTPVESIDSLTYDEMLDVDTLHLLLPRTLIKTIHDTVVETQVVHDTIVEIVHDTVVEVQTQIVHDTVYVELPCHEEPSVPSEGIGAFSVSADKQVTFSKGNLQYHPANDEWRFAKNQWDYIGNANSNLAADYDGWIDLFGWGTGDYPINSSWSSEDYQTFVDWGTNKIGDDAPNIWRTLTEDEWSYIRNSRINAHNLLGIAQVNGVNGLILLPDNWSCPEDLIFKVGDDDDSSSCKECYARYQTFTADQWLKLEATGAIFLPAAGRRGGETYMFDLQVRGIYHSTSVADSENVYTFDFDPGYTNTYSNRNFYGYSVRLVKDL